MDPDGRSAVVTGAGNGIGEAIARRLAAEGAAVMVVDIDEAAGVSTVDAIDRAGGRASFARADVSQPDDVAGMLAAAEAAHGPLEILVNNAGVVTPEDARFPDFEVADWMRVLDVNLRGVMLGTHLAVRAMRAHGRGGAIVNIASLAGVGHSSHPSPDYAASKAGVIRFTTALGWLADDGIRVNCVCPDWVDTPMSRLTRERMSEDELRAVVPPELLSGDDIADAALAFIRGDELAGRVMGCYCGRGNFRRLLPLDDVW